MSVLKDYTLGAQADLEGVNFEVMRQMILARARSSNLKILQDEEMHLTVETAHGLIGLRPGRQTETAGLVAAESEQWLFVLKNAVLQQVRQFNPDVAEAMRWSDLDREGTLPPNFSFVRVVEVSRLGTVFLRVTLEGEDLSHHKDDAIHFRLVQPSNDPEKGTAPLWPYVAPNGSIKWPDGPNTPHKPVYTTRFVDHAKNQLVTDVFMHEGGRTYDWAKGILEGVGGRQVGGLVGPAGGGLLNASKVLMASDETGFPSAARLLENLPAGASGEVLLEAQYGAACEYPINAPDGVNITWLSRDHGDQLARSTLLTMPKHQDATLWFAGSKEQARQVRERAKADGWTSDRLRVSGFWS